MTLDEELEKRTQEINTQGVQDAQYNKPLYPFVAMAQQTADALIEATQRAVTEANNLLESNKAYIAEYLEDIKKRSNELKNLEERQRQLAEDTLRAHEKFNGDLKSPGFYDGGAR